MICDEELELLESYLDGELPEEDGAELRKRLLSEPALSRELENCRSARSIRESTFATLEGDDELADRLLAAVERESARRELRRSSVRRLGFAAAAAACIVAGFFAGWMGSTNRSSTAQADAPIYKVEIRDGEGSLIGVQPFDSLERAREFSNDLRNWQERQHRLLSGRVTIQSASF